MAKPRTKWHHIDYGADKKTWIKIGFTKSQDYKYDCVRIQCKTAWGKSDDFDQCFRLDEASSISAGLMKCLDHALQYGTKELQEYMKGHKEDKL